MRSNSFSTNINSWKPLFKVQMYAHTCVKCFTELALNSNIFNLNKLYPNRRKSEWRSLKNKRNNTIDRIGKLKELMSSPVYLYIFLGRMYNIEPSKLRCILDINKGLFCPNEVLLYSMLYMTVPQIASADISSNHQ